MIITGKNSKELLQSFPKTLKSFFATVARAIEAGPEKMGFEDARVVDGVLYFKKNDTNGYLAVNPAEKRMFNVDDDLQPINAPYDLSQEQIEGVDGQLQHILNS